MSPITHALAGWVVAELRALPARDRALITLAGVIPDLDGVGIVIDFVTGGQTDYWTAWHHVLCHNLGFALVVSGSAAALATRRAWTTAMVLLSFHLHLLGDLVGARGPDGNQWPIPYLSPFSDAWSLTWAGQWPLNGWPNFVITGALLVTTFRLAVRRGYSPVGLASTRADAAVVAVFRKWAGRPPTSS